MRQRLIDRSNDQLIEEIIECGYELEGVEHNKRFCGYPGFDMKTLGNERDKIRKRMIKRIQVLDVRGINVYAMDDYTKSDGTILDLEYPMQFI